MASETRLLPSNSLLTNRELIELVNRLEIERQPLRPFHQTVLDFCESLARSIRQSKDIRSRPALAALAWWLRPGSLLQLQHFWDQQSAKSPTTIRVPRGIVFHVPPTNVETIVVYSWICSALAGNANIIRISESNNSENEMLFDILFETLKEFPLISKTTLFVKYGYDSDVTEILSHTDARAIWGGDATINSIRAVKTSPRSIDLPFSNRFSFSLISADAICNGSDDELKRFAHNFVNDAYWFDQVACSSPKLIFLLESSEENETGALSRLIQCLTDELDVKGVEVSPSTSMSKLVNSFALAAEGTVGLIHRPNHQITVGEITDFASFTRDTPGGGLFYLVKIKDVNQIVPFVTRTDQTMTHYGVTEEDLRLLIDLLNGRGVDRIVPVGEALSFDIFWDGFNLLDSFSKIVNLKT